MPLPAALLMFIAYRNAENRILSAVTDAGHEITLAQARILTRIGDDGTRIGDLAEQAQITRQTATALVDKLEEAGLVHRGQDPRDGRVRLVHLSERARRKIVPVARHQEQLIEEEWTTHLGPERMGQLRSALESLREITDLSGAD